MILRSPILDLDQLKVMKNVMFFYLDINNVILFYTQQTELSKPEINHTLFQS